ncbi:LCP family protein [Streptomyces sp. NPDC053431]|uniref:LCP family protein n=1 Tax=Streptomyces sp. NPDC053431 TaxID=3365703 RepID=UPI0037D28C2A
MNSPHPHPDLRSRPRPRPRSGFRGRRLLVLTTALVALGSGAFAAAPDPLPSPPKGLNILLVGVDSRAGVTPEERKRYYLGNKDCGCSDVMMLVHVSARNDRVSVVSLPRDSLSEFPEHVDRNTGEMLAPHQAKLNAAWKEGGPSFAIEMVEAMTNVPVDRYLEIDFRRFMDTVNVVHDGVPICTDRHLKDPSTGLDLAPGTRRVLGGEALQYVRSRKADGQADFGRIKKQQRFVVNTLREIRDDLFHGTAGLRRFVATLRGTQQTERGISTSELLTLAARLRHLSPEQTEFATVPIRTINPLIPGVGATISWDEEYADEVFGHLREDEGLPEPRPVPQSETPLGEYEPYGGDSVLCP